MTYKTPSYWARAALNMLRECAEQRVAEQGRTYFKPHEKVALLGIKTQKARDIEKEIFRAVKPTWSIQDALAFCDTLIRNRYLEAKGIGILLLSRYHRRYDRDMFEIIRGWLADGHCSNWASTDALSIVILAPLLTGYPELLKELLDWTQSANPWVRRAAAVSLTPLARKGKHLDTAYGIAHSLLDAPEDLMHKAVGWLLRECGKTDDRRLEAFLLTHGARVPRTALRYAIERYPEARRKRILVQTKASFGP